MSPRTRAGRIQGFEGKRHDAIESRMVPPGCVGPGRVPGRMRWPFAMVSALVALCSVWGSGVSADAPLHAQGLLWTIEHAGQRPSILFGTMHLDDSRVNELPPAVQRAFDASDSFTMEAILDLAAVGTLTQAMFYPDSSSLRQALGEDTFRRAVAALEEHGLAEPALVERMKPWAIYMMLSQPGSGIAVPMDLRLYAMALQQGKPVYGLESIEAQIAVFDQLPVSEQVMLLRDTLDLLPRLDQIYDEVTAAYLRRDLAHVLDLQDRLIAPSSRRIYRDFMRRLLDDRNMQMVDRMKPRLAEGNAFIAVGALHLPGTNGILHLLEQRGYRVTSIY